MTHSSEWLNQAVILKKSRFLVGLKVLDYAKGEIRWKRLEKTWNLGYLELQVKTFPTATKVAYLPK